MLNEYGVPYNGYSLTIMDGEEVIIDIGNKSDFNRIVIRDGSPYWVDDGSCEILIEDVYDCETETALDPAKWYEESVKPYESAYIKR